MTRREPPVVWCEVSEVRALRESDRPGHHVVVVPATVHDSAEFMDVIASLPTTPRYFGRNWDAVADVVGDMGHVLLVVEAPQLLDPAVWSALRSLGNNPEIEVIAVRRPDDVSDSSPVGDG